MFITFLTSLACGAVFPKLNSVIFYAIFVPGIQICCSIGGEESKPVLRKNTRLCTLLAP